MNNKMTLIDDIQRMGALTVDDVVRLYPELAKNRRQVIYAISQGKLLAIRKGEGSSPWLTTELEVKRWIDRTYKTNI
tara:strand:- start:1027 stop:1257 length:231 start_codon:yes stop_codon:yes gene_type:complete